jgi:hypothetical protein
MGIVIFIVVLFYLAVIGLLVASNWKIYVKAGKPGWAAIVPIYNLIVLLEIIRKPMIWILYMFIPIVNIIFLFKAYIELAKVFGKDSAWGIGMALLPYIFLPMLAFGDAVYISNEPNFDEFGKPVLNPNFESQVR